MMRNISIKPQLLSQQCGSELSAPAVDVEVFRLVEYLREQGHHVRSGSDVYEAIRSMPNEDELNAERRAEGVVVTHASDGWALMIPLGELMPGGVELAGAASRRDDAC